MELAVSKSRRLPNRTATALAIVGSLIFSVIVGLSAGFVVVLLWFRDTRGDGFAAFEIATISAGLLVSTVLFVWLLIHHHRPSRFLLAVPAFPWLTVAIYLTWVTCAGSFITWSNWVWILKSGDDRNYELGWIIRGWISILLSLVAAVAIGRVILRARERTRINNVAR